MSDSDLIDAVARKTGEDAHEIRRRGFVLTGPDDSCDPIRDGPGVWWRCPSLPAPTPVAFSFPTPTQAKTIPMLKPHAGVSKKVGLPGFSSASASCTIEAELDGSLLHDHEGFQIVVQKAYQSCEKAVEDQIARLLVQGNRTPNSPACAPDILEHTQSTNGPQTRSQSPSRASQPVTQEVIEVRTSPAISGTRITTTSNSLPSPRPATASQVKAIRAIAARRKIDLVGLLRDKFGLTTADELGIRQASNLIDELKGDEPAATPANGNGSYATTGGAR